ncbi:MAG: segregation/condensation protein A [Kiritimatiellae bacterium]|nr:segregation/condensation protein A [Kiritimatiellia bacterium]MDD3544094.1 segregation/condensation protein A [Kiritimatiellia bacterium]MDD4024384.1 segregation/condensation protein A [Kiritimatiellia bacterium]MDD4621633.1 segregation/condensation protein A [Kiritimatiellia bacterium]
MSLQALLADDYKVDLEVFEGPLDLLLYLIRRDEVDIYDIPIEKITKQYLAYLDVMRMLDLNIAGEFLVMAATLMMIKSRMLLPVEARGAEDAQDDDWVDPRLDLVRQLIEYKKFKDAAAKLLEKETLRGEAFVFGGEKPAFEKTEEDAGLALADIGLFDLLTAFQEVLERAPSNPFEQIDPIRWSVPDKMEMIISRTKGGQRLFFSKLFTAESHRMEVIVTFLALLELLRLRQVSLYQNTAFHDILILSAEPFNEDGQSPIIGGGEHVTS